MRRIAMLLLRNRVVLLEWVLLELRELLWNCRVGLLRKDSERILMNGLIVLALLVGVWNSF